MDFRSLPKVELHLHLDCSLSYDVVNHLDPSITLQDYRRDFVADGKCHNLADYLQRAIKGIELMQTEDHLIAVTNDLYKQLEADGVIYAEIRFAPLQHLQNGLTAEQVVDIVESTMTSATAKTGIQTRLILCTLRHFSEAESMQTAMLIERFQDTAVVGLDIAADESGYPLKNHLSAFKFARDHGFGITAHAGEACGPESVWETLEHLKPSRIGHGVRSAEDGRLLRFLRDYNIHLEICPTSNIQTNIYSGLSDHPIDKIYQTGVSCSINTDGRAISDISLSQEYENLHRQFGWSQAQFLRCNLSAIEAAFISDDLRRQLIDQLKKGYQ